MTPEGRGHVREACDRLSAPQGWGWGPHRGHTELSKQTSWECGGGALERKGFSALGRGPRGR